MCAADSLQRWRSAAKYFKIWYCFHPTAHLKGELARYRQLVVAHRTLLFAAHYPIYNMTGAHQDSAKSVSSTYRFLAPLPPLLSAVTSHHLHAESTRFLPPALPRPWQQLHLTMHPLPQLSPGPHAVGGERHLHRMETPLVSGAQPKDSGSHHPTLAFDDRLACRKIGQNIRQLFVWCAMDAIAFWLVQMRCCCFLGTAT